MPQSSKDSNGGKNHPAKDKNTGKGAPRSSTAPERNPNSPTGSHNRGEKKTTP
ncbi:MAG TPA: hypothetical protein VE934_09260 [Polaromonas sp.]|uniref:hypothetical protein n=1 Tax=Polaromonas sp. TaxID=1869339 RepID=UPI002D3E4DB7|nr:hypothetical protein [Polaromonas sp.]HYW57138.1 hypothetical protein [Polaromonas sp.]